MEFKFYFTNPVCRVALNIGQSGGNRLLGTFWQCQTICRDMDQEDTADEDDSM